MRYRTYQNDKGQWQVYDKHTGNFIGPSYTYQQDAIRAADKRNAKEHKPSHK